MAEGERLRQALRAGRKLLGGWVNMASPIATEIMAGAGFDLLMIDQEHGPGDALTAIAQQQAIRAGAPASHPVAACLRVHDGHPQLVKRALDTGIDGLMVPLVETAEAAAAVVSACLAPPAGRRGVAPGNVRAAAYGYGKDRFVAAGGRDVFVAVQVETEATVARLDEIAAVAGIDMLFIGRNDLASSIGKLHDQDAPEAVALREEAERRIGESGRWLGGIPAPGDSAAAMFERGYHLVIATADHALLREGALAITTALVPHRRTPS